MSAPSLSATARSAPATLKPTAAPTPVAISADQPLIAFQWVDGGKSDALFLMAPDGSGAQPIADLPGTITLHPAWSPDGRWLAFEAAGPKAMDLWVAQPDGSGLRLVIERNDVCHEVICGDAGYPAWSGSGDRIAFVRFDFERGRYTGSALEVVDVASGARTVVYESDTAYIEYPRWSPDDTRLVFETLTVDSTGNPTASWLSVVKVGKRPAPARAITDKAMWATYPDWRRADDLIVFTTYDLGAFQQTDEPSNLYTIHPDGSAMRQLTHYGHAEDRATQPTWTPDGSRILFTLVGQNPGRFDGPRHAAFIDPDGTGLQVLDPDATHPRVRPSA